MFDIGWSELLIVAIVAIVVIGPKDLPAAMRAVGGMLTKLRRMAGEFQGQFREAMKEAELGDVAKDFDQIRSSVSSMKGGLGMTPAGLVKKEIGGAITGTGAATGAAASASMKPAPSPPPPPPPTVAQIEAMSGATPAAPTVAAAAVSSAEPPPVIPSAFAPMPMFRKK